ncbi:MAG: acyl-CoA desaturase [Bacteroidia bacterium]|jgi:linoleoyl-CoA desaturase|nr:acyl-CoA desaturase [Bacteroidia bacterium]
MQKVRFANDHKLFTAALKSKVNDYFTKNNLSPAGNFRLYLKTIVFIATAILCYVVLMLDILPAWAALSMCALLGVAFSGIGFNVMHDGGHNSYSSKKWVNELMSYSLNVLGGNIYLWKVKHNLNHHSFTNIDGIDEDIDIRPFLRTGTDQPLRGYHRYQHIYWVVLYGMVYFAWIFIKDFKKYFSGKIADTRFKKMNRREHIIFWASKLIYLGIFIVFPSLQLGFLPVITGYAVLSVVCGFILGIVFQMAHVTQGTSVHTATYEKTNDMSDWFVHQLATTANFSTKSKLVSWFAGGLNFQVEHHLFPQISHVHYPEINRLVKATCREYNIRYSEYPTFYSALRSHVEYLKTVGRQ